VIWFLRDMMRVLSLPCREHAVLFSRQIDAPLSGGESFGLRVHVLYCGGCRRFRDHLLHLQLLGRTLAKDVQHEPGLPAEVRERLNARVAQASKKN